MDRATKLLVISRTVHEAIRAFQAALGEREAPAWPESGAMQESTHEAVEFALRNPTPGAQHRAWVESKIRQGWRYGERKDETEKTHPSLVAFEKLSPAEQLKDAILIAVVRALAEPLELAPASPAET